MPYKLSEAEKEQIRENYRHNIETINSHIEDEDFHYRVDMASLNKKLNDPALGWLYKKSLEAYQREIKKKDIQERLEAELADQKIPGKIYPLGRYLHTELIASDDPEAEAYNRAVVTAYYKHPEAFVQRKFQRLMGGDYQIVADIAQCKDKEALMAAWAADHPSEIQECFEMFGTIGAYKDDLLHPDVLKYKESIGRNLEPLYDTNQWPGRTAGDGIFTAPDWDHEHENAVDYAFENEQEIISKVRQKTNFNMERPIKTGSFVNFFNTLKKNNVDISGPGGMLNYIVTKNVNGKEKQLSLSLWAAPKGDANGEAGELNDNIKLKRLDDQTKKNIQQFFKKDYIKEENFKMPEIPDKFKEPAWKVARDELVFKYSVKENLRIHEVDNGGFSKIAEAIPTTFGEKIFGKSKQWANVIQTLKDFDNEKHVNHNNSKPVKLAANDYLMHKGVKTREEALRLPQPSRDRALLCLDTLNTFQAAEPKNEPKIIPGTREYLKNGTQEKKWPPAFENAAQVEDDNLIVQEQQNQQPVIQNEIQAQHQEKVNEAKEKEPEPSLELSDDNSIHSA